MWAGIIVLSKMCVYMRVRMSAQPGKLCSKQPDWRCSELIDFAGLLKLPLRGIHGANENEICCVSVQMYIINLR